MRRAERRAIPRRHPTGTQASPEPCADLIRDRPRQRRFLLDLLVLPCAALERVPARSALQFVPAGFPIELVIALPALQGVIACAGTDQIVAGESGESVIATKPRHHVPAGSARKHVLALRPEDCH